MVVNVLLWGYLKGQNEPIHKEKSKLAIPPNVLSTFSELPKYLTKAMNLNEFARSKGLGSFELSLGVMDKRTQRAEVFTVRTQEQWDIWAKDIDNQQNVWLQVTLLQKDIVWCRGNKVVAVVADSSSSSNSASPKDPKGKGRPRKASSEEDRLLIAALRSGKAVERNEHQSNELEHLKAELQKYGNAYDVTEISARCGLCKSSVSLPADRQVKGKVTYFKSKHFDACEKRNRKDRKRKSQTDIGSFVTKTPRLGQARTTATTTSSSTEGPQNADSDVDEDLIMPGVTPENQSQDV